jgi:nitroreductase/NAD-dependent dihydropyrimidine dehydrogenase PreA subunit
VKLTINESKCKRDGLCAQECPFGLIDLAGADGYPRLTPGLEQACLVCGHCVSVCPCEALSHEQVPRENCPSIEEGLDITEAQAWQFLRSRRSIRRFKDKPVEKEKIEKLIGLARHAPTAANSQKLHWTVFTDRAQIHSLAGLTVEWIREVIKAPGKFPYFFSIFVERWDRGYDSILCNAPALIIASAPLEAAFGLTDIGIALAYLQLAAPKLGLGSCWIGVLSGALSASAAVKGAVGLPESHQWHSAVVLGYPVPKHYRLPMRKAPRITWK